MTIRRFCLLLVISAVSCYLQEIAQAQCQNQGCNRPILTGCYSCVTQMGTNCTLSTAACSTSCTETSCSAGGDGGEELLSLNLPGLSVLPVASKAPGKQRDALFAVHPAIAAKPRPIRCGSQLPTNVLFAL
jgi:hypothetical protein